MKEFDKWWDEEQGSRMKGSRYIGKKAWKAALEWVSSQEHEVIYEKIEEELENDS
jgi:hypothetical protein